MVNLVLLGVLVVAIGGCVCVLWAGRGGPRWVRGVASVTLAVSELVRRAEKRNRRRSSGTTSGRD
ncbi:hypothetical protein CP981_37170 [Streptomyces platensis]|uniref:Uncharacterized protein n=1 Tax=Streptomyces platensis TaxID=58346 RepID=A0AAE6NR93_STRPT|nr:hypothetical protein [Streptomyces platensis]OSY42575.1 hypothetical protein BG653_04735 [Streptomyces platensis]QEV57313.1 hypothetical protein CP981_37170 [Streptomyces platensis]